MLHRRDLLHVALAASGGSLLGSSVDARDDSPPSMAGIIDTNVHLFQWPFRRLPLDTTEKLVQKFRVLGISQAWAGSFEGLLHRDITSVNERLVQACSAYPELVPIGSINPILPDWEHDLEQCLGKHQMPGVRLHPNYHGYTLADSRFLDVLERVALKGRFAQLVVAMEDTRTQHPLVQVADVDLTPLHTLLRDSKPVQEARRRQGRDGMLIQILNARPRGELLTQLAATPGVCFDTARVDGTDGITRLLKAVPPARVMLGTHSPFLIPEAALIRLAESLFDDDQLNAVARNNALAVGKGPR